MDNDKVMLVFYYEMRENEESKRICSFMTSRFAEWMKLLNYCKHHKVDFWVREDDESIPKDVIEKMSGVGSSVEDVNVTFGSDDCIQVIEVYLK